MSTNGDFNQQPNETDVEQFDRILEKLQESFIKIGKITDQLTKSQFAKLVQQTNRYMSDEKKRMHNLDMAQKKMELLNERTEARIKVEEKATKNTEKLLSLREAEARQRTKDKMTLQRQHASDVKDHILLRQRVKGTTDELKFFTNALTKGISFGQLGGMGFQQILSAYNRQKEQEDIDAKIDIITQQLKKTLPKEQQEDLREELKHLVEEKRKVDDSMAGGTAQGLLGKRGMGYLKSMGEFANKHKVGILLGATSAGILLTVLKKAIDVSPVFQSMLKLLNFGFMLILRPIGDFFGFIMRPVMILLLRKFIIPFYQFLYPKLMKLGTEIGESLSGKLGAILSGDPEKILKEFFGFDKENDLFTNFTNAVIGITTILGGAGIAGVTLYGSLLAFRTLVGTINTALEALGLKAPTPPTTTGSGSTGSSGTGSSGKDTSSRSAIKESKFVAEGSKTTGKGEFMGRGTSTSKQTLTTGKFSNNPAIKAFQKFVERVNEVKIRRGFGAEYVTEQITNYLSKNTAIQQMSRVGSRFKNTVQSFAKRLEPIINRLGGTQGLAKGGFWGLAFKLMEDMFNIKIDDNAGQGVAMANGGLITEPIMGVGQRTGKSYLMGEAGNEYVVPQNKMNTGVNLTINIQNMSGNREDINKLRDVVLRVMQESSSKMVR